MKKTRLISVLLLVFLFLLIPLSVQAASNIAILTVFSDPTKSYVGSSGLKYDVGTHSWITVKNIASTSITVGALNGIAPGKTVSVGTWSDLVTKEHKGIWYNLEARYIREDGAYSGRVSRTYYLTATKLDTLNKKIKNNDRWYLIQPCSYWACMQWNSVADSSLSSVFPSTPKKLAASIKATSGWTTRAAVPYDYPVYYANGAGTPIRSIIYY